MTRTVNKIETIITFADYRNDFVAELWLNDIHIAELFIDDSGQKQIELYSGEGKDILQLPFQDLLNALNQCAQKLG